MSDPVLIDAGPLVALLNDSEQAHVWAKEQVAELTGSFLTCEPVITEACFLMARLPNGVDQVLAAVARGDIRIDFSLSDHVASIKALMAKYADQPMSLADACLVRMAELHPRARVFTLDRHFRVYRMHGRKMVPVIMP